MEPAGADDWSPAEINRPFTTGDHLWTEQGARAELHLDNAVLRLDARSSFGFLNLDDRITQLKLSQGELCIRTRQPDPEESFEVGTPNAAINILRDGEYLVRVDGDDHVTTLVVRHGEAEVSDGTPPDVIGYEDLDSYGSWRDMPNYGPVWVPRVAAGWAPYRFGHWTWIDPWGWTWVDDAPWSFAPFHSGRWAFLACGRPQLGRFALHRSWTGWMGASRAG